MRIRLAALLVVLLVASRLFGASNPDVFVRLTIDPYRTIPGLPLPMYVEIENRGPGHFDFRRLKFRATPAEGEPFIIRWGLDSHRGLIEEAPVDWTREVMFPVPPGKKTYVTVPVDFLPRQGWMYDTRLCAPGVYRIEAVLDDPDRPDAPAIVSSPAEIEVMRPADRDALIYLRLLKGEVASGLADQVYRDSPDSPFLPFLAVHVTRAHEKPEHSIALLTHILKLHPKTPIAPLLVADITAHYERLA